jgi:hypothetical protein
MSRKTRVLNGVVISKSKIPHLAKRPHLLSRSTKPQRTEYGRKEDVPWGGTESRREGRRISRIVEARRWK